MKFPYVNSPDQEHRSSISKTSYGVYIPQLHLLAVNFHVNYNEIFARNQERNDTSITKQNTPGQDKRAQIKDKLYLMISLSFKTDDAPNKGIVKRCFSRVRGHN